MKGIVKKLKYFPVNVMNSLYIFSDLAEAVSQDSPLPILKIEREGTLCLKTALLKDG
ncbi:hypothetical protein SAMN05216353_15415 [Halobacillus alkaliphilus]|uniref:Uncharacterized protein n=1 Tax=Halobacillus alkaliphilus TaxID=396056 RepID=A0A1I2SPV1_9BACI|nr:hypothetical protein SAMN05216353_15415 [Halobacillus alkaliphilus]